MIESRFHVCIMYMALNIYIKRFYRIIADKYVYVKN